MVEFGLKLEDNKVDEWYVSIERILVSRMSRQSTVYLSGTHRAPNPSFR